MTETAAAESGVARLEAAFARAAQGGRAALIPYFCAGDPDAATSALLLETATQCDADVLEIGIPYGDPLADGPTIAAAAQRALAGGMDVAGALALAGAARAAGAPPILLFTYVNPILQFGPERFATALVAAGACGAIVPDLPVEEMDALRRVFEPRGLALPLLIAPSTPPERARALAEASQGFVYLVSRLGVTGARREPDLVWLRARVAELRAAVARPVAVGFGIATPEQVRSIASFADGAIVGSALIDAYAGSSGEKAASRVRTLLRALDAARIRPV